MTLLTQLKNKKIIILGYGKEGESTLRFLQENNITSHKIGIADKNEKSVGERGVVEHFGPHYMEAVKDYDIIIKAPGIPFFDVSITDQQILTSQSDIFLSNHKGRVIGITGTKGKSTTAKIIYEILRKNNNDCFLIGNIGSPALDHLLQGKEDTFYVYELSSFQLQNITRSPYISLMLNIFTDHLDKHKSFHEYVSAKENITRFQTSDDFFIFNEEDKNIKEISKKTKAKKIPFTPTFAEGITTPVAPVKKVMEILNVDKKLMEEVLSGFKNLPHRTEFIGTYNGISFYNDSAATIPEATVAAISNIKNTDSIIVGGSDKGADFSPLIEKIAKSKINNIIILEGSPHLFTEEVKKLQRKTFTVSSMKEAVGICYKQTQKNKACLLSPGFASFNMFKNLQERGELFKKEVFNKANEA